MQRSVVFVLPVVVVLLWLGLMSIAYRRGRLPKFSGVDWRERFQANRVEISQES
jgi:hypothetical protein